MYSGVDGILSWNGSLLMAASILPKRNANLGEPPPPPLPSPFPLVCEPFPKVSPVKHLMSN